MLYEIISNNEKHYIHSNNVYNALNGIKRRLLKKFGKYNITDVRIKNDDNTWSRIIY